MSDKAQVNFLFYVPSGITMGTIIVTDGSKNQRWCFDNVQDVLEFSKTYIGSLEARIAWHTPDADC